MAFVLLGYPSVELVLRGEDLRLFEHGLAWPRRSLGARMVFIASGGKLRNLLHMSWSKAASSSPSPLMPCSLMSAGSQPRSESRRARMTVAHSTALFRAASSRNCLAHAAFLSLRSLAHPSCSDASSAALVASRAAASSRGARLGIRRMKGCGKAEMWKGREQSPPSTAAERREREVATCFLSSTSTRIFAPQSGDGLGVFGGRSCCMAAARMALGTATSNNFGQKTAQQSKCQSAISHSQQ